MQLEWRNPVLEGVFGGGGWSLICRIRLGSLDFQGEVTARHDGTYMATISLLPEDRKQPPSVVWKRIAQNEGEAKHLVEAEVRSWLADLSR